MVYKRKKKKIAKYTDLNGGEIINLKTWKIKHPNEVYFDSRFEYDCYVVLKKAFGNNLDFSPGSVDLFEAFKDFTNIKSGKLQTTSVRKCSYTPDFIINCPDGFKVYIDAKGHFFPESRLRYKIFQNLIIKGNPEIISIIIETLEEVHSLSRIIKSEHFPVKKINTTDL